MGLLSLPLYGKILLVILFAGCLYLVRYSKLSYLLPKYWITWDMIRKKGEKLGCELPYLETSWFFGLDRMQAQMKAHREHRGLERSKKIMMESGARTHGKFFLGKYIIFTMDPANIQSVLATDFNSYGLANLRTVFVPLLGEGGIFTSDGQQWKHGREALRPSFTRAHIQDVSSFEPHIQNLFQRIPRDGSTVDLAPLFYDLAMDISTEFLFGESTKALQGSKMSPEVSRFVVAWNSVMDDFSEGRKKGGGILSVFFSATSLQDDCKVVHDFVDRMIARSAAKFREKGGASDTFLGGLLENIQSPEQLRVQVINVLLAGRDTTSALLANLVLHISQRKDIQDKLRNEIKDLQNPPTYESIKELKYLRFCIQESLRLAPIVPHNAREAMQDTTLPRGGGPDQTSPVFVPRGTLIAYNTYALHRNEDVWGQDADEFNPERWIDTEERRGIRPGFNYIPFNAGPRICIGQQFAMTEVSYVLIRLLQEFPVIESRDPEPWKELVLVTLSSLNGCKIAIPPNLK